MKTVLTTALIFSAALTVYASDAVSSSSTVKNAPEETAVPTVTPAVVPTAVEEKPAALAGSVAPLRDLVTFHEKEAESLKKMIDRWETKVEAASKRRQSLAQDVQTLLQKADEAQKQDTKAARREADRLRKQAARINKDIVAADKELKNLSKDLAGEVRDVSNETQQALRDAYQQAVEEIQKPRD